MENVKPQFAARLRKAMEKAGLSPEPAVLERHFNQHYYGKPMTLHGVRKWLIGESIPPYDKIITLAGMLHVPPEELTYGIEVKQKVQERNARWREAIGYQEREVFEAFLSLPVPQRKVVREVILAFARAYPAKARGGENTPGA